MNLGYEAPAVLHSKFVPSLQGIQTKMSSTDQMSAINLEDMDTQLQEKVCC